MKIILPYFVVLLIIASFTGCQEEIIEIRKPAPEGAFTASSPVAQLMQRVALKDGSEDNIISGASCISFALPVTVIVNDQEIVVNNEDDLDEIEKLIDKSDNDEDDIQEIFPVKIILPDYTELIISNEDELDDFIDDCLENEFDEDIECVDFQFPIQFTIYDANNQFFEAVNIRNNKELYHFIDNVDDDIYVSIDFPVTLLLFDGTELTANNNDQLEDIIDDAEDSCDEDDDNDFDDDDVDDSNFKAILTSGEWHITHYFDESDQTSLFANWVFSFTADGSIIATDGNKSFTGEWETSGDSGHLEMEIDFDSDEPVEELDEDWIVKSFSDTRIELEDEDDEDDKVVIVFEKL